MRKKDRCKIEAGNSQLVQKHVQRLHPPDHHHIVQGYCAINLHWLALNGGWCWVFASSHYCWGRDHSSWCVNPSCSPAICNNDISSQCCCSSKTDICIECSFEKCENFTYQFPPNLIFIALHSLVWPVLWEHAVKMDVSLCSHFELGVHHHCFYLNNST